MVLPGQYLERPALVDAGELTLEGLFHRGRRRPALLVCPPLGDGPGMDAPAVAELAWAAARAGHPSLRFQHRGRGASQGQPDEARALDDALAAWRHLAETVGAEGPGLAVAGIGRGCETAAALARARRIGALALVAPASLPPLDGVLAPVLVVLPERGDPALAAAAARLAGPGSARGRVEIIPGADPGFLAGLPLVGRAVVAWLRHGG